MSDTAYGGFDPALKRLSAVVMLGAVMTVLDTTIVSVAINTLGRDFEVSVATIQWVATGYLLALSMVIPLTGWAVERFGARRLWFASLTLFLAGSVLSGAAWSAGSLIVFRVIQGIGGGIILPVGQTMLARAAGPQRMGRVMSVVAVPALLGPVLGPVIGGLIVDAISWRWIFYVNLPVGAIALLAAWRCSPAPRPAPARRTPTASRSGGTSAPPRSWRCRPSRCRAGPPRRFHAPQEPGRTTPSISSRATLRSRPPV